MNVISDRLRNALLGVDSTIRQAMERLDNSGFKICLVRDENERILGIITDGDIRRGLLRGLELSSLAVQVMRTQFVYVVEEDGYRQKAHTLARQKNLDQVPVIDSKGRLVTIIFNSCLLRDEPKENFVVIMAGGMGMRLRPLTENCPKPLLQLGGRPVLENLILNFKKYGFSRFYLSINYLGHMIRDYFKDGSWLDVDIRYIEEHSRLGTAGALSLLPEKPIMPILVTNGDLIMKLDIDDFVMHHIDSKVAGTMCIRQYGIQVPYGVVQTDGQHITSFLEKPSYSYLINAGLYCLEPDTLDMIPQGSHFDMPALFEAIVGSGKKAGIYITDGLWMDIGNIDDYRYACENASILLDSLEKQI
jgi:dTDP-glucose pyrophosphorylase/predicted transcriptional regulator